MKKIISITLALVMLFAMSAPMMNAFAADANKYITIYVEGYGHPLYKNNVPTEENRIYDIDADVGAIVSEVLKPCLEKLAFGILTDNYDAYCDELYNAMAPLYADLKLDPSGEALDGSGWGGDMLTGYYYVNYGKGLSGGRITFEYDWRLAPEHNAEILEKFIDRVCREKGVAKVNVLGRCLGGNIVNAYLENGKNLNKVNKVIMYIPSTMGISTVGAAFSGNIVVQDKAVDNFVDLLVNDMALISDPTMQSLITATVSLLDYAKTLGLGTDALMFIVNKVKGNIIPRLVRDTYGSFPSFWSMCPEEYLDDALALCYGTEELKAEYAGTIEKINSFREIRKNAYNRMEEVKANGIDIMVLSKYNLPNLPFSVDGTAQSDMMAETYRTSFGSTSPEFGKTFTESYLASKTEAEKKFISPDLKVDASTCLFPEKTWFIKNSAHSKFPDSVDALMDAFLCNDDFTVFSSEAYPQYMELAADEDKISPVTGLDDPVPEEGSNAERFSIFVRFMTAIMNFITKLFKGNLNLNLNLNLGV